MDHKNSQKIKCTVEDCMHNNRQDCICKLNKISVSPCGNAQTPDAKESTACLSYEYSEEKHKDNT